MKMISLVSYNAAKRLQKERRRVDELEQQIYLLVEDNLKYILTDLNDMLYLSVLKPNEKARYLSTPDGTVVLIFTNSDTTGKTDLTLSDLNWIGNGLTAVLAKLQAEKAERRAAVHQKLVQTQTGQGDTPTCG